MEAQTMEPMYLSIQPEKTGERIKKLLLEQGYTIREIQGAFGFENPQAIYKWLSGKSLPSIDNFVMIGTSESVFSMLQYIRYQETRS